MTLGLLLETHPVREVAASGRPLAAIRLLVFHATIESLIVFRHLYRFLLRDLEIDSLGGRHQTDGHVAKPGGIVAEIDAEGSVAVVDDFPRDEEVKLDRFDVGMKVAPAEHLLKLACFHIGAAFGPGEGCFCVGEVG